MSNIFAPGPRLGMAMALSALAPAAADFVSVSPAATSVERYHPLIVSIAVTKTFQNGFDPDQIKVDLELTGPGGEAIVQPCFYKGDQGANALFEARFAPRAVGNYGYKVAVDEKGSVKRSEAFTLASQAGPTNGFLHLDTTASALYGFRFDSGRLWRGIGENVAWEPGGFTYATVLPRLNGLGCNMIRIWHCPWHMPIEWNSAPTVFNTRNSEAMDALVTLAEKNGIYLMVMMNDYREFSEQWNSDPYSTAKGGPCATAKDFFSNAEAKAIYKKKIRYYVARWGYSPNIQSWEFFNEIDNAVGATGIDAKSLATWHDEMAAEFHRVDPYRHLVTSSVSWVYEQMWASPDIDFTQSHLCGPSNKIGKLPAETKRYIDGFKKPYVCGEFARRWEAATTEVSDNYRIDLHYGMWLGMFQQNPIVPMTWWWDSHFRWGDDFVFKSAAGFHNDILARTDIRTLTRLEVAATAGQQAGGLRTGNHGFIWVSNYAGTAAANNVTLTVTGLRNQNDDYSLEWYDTWNGGYTAAPGQKSQNGILVINAGSIAAGQDKALRIVNLSEPAVALGGEPGVPLPAVFAWSRIEAGLAVSGLGEGPAELALYAPDGRLALRKTEAGNHGGRVVLATQGLPGGLYLLRVRSGARLGALKITL